MIRATARWLWRVLALLSLALAIAGAVLPVLPTVPFLLVAAAAAGRGWPQLEAWLLAHPRYGPPIRRWRERGAGQLRIHEGIGINAVEFAARRAPFLPRWPLGDRRASLSATAYNSGYRQASSAGYAD